MNTLQVKAAVRIRDGYSCVECGMSNNDHLTKYGHSLDVHRIVPGSQYTVDGCQTLCRSCHGKKPKSERGTRGILHVWVDDHIAEALEKSRVEAGRTRQTHVLIIMDWWFRKHGYLKD